MKGAENVAESFSSHSSILRRTGKENVNNTLFVSVEGCMFILYL